MRPSASVRADQTSAGDARDIKRNSQLLLVVRALSNDFEGQIVGAFGHHCLLVWFSSSLVQLGRLLVSRLALIRLVNAGVDAEDELVGARLVVRVVVDFSDGVTDPASQELSESGKLPRTLERHARVDAEGRQVFAGFVGARTQLRELAQHLAREGHEPSP